MNASNSHDRSLVFVVLSFLLIFLASHAVTAQSASEDSQPKLISAEEYRLSPEAIEAGIDGKVILRVSIDKTGTVTKADVILGPAWPCGASPNREIAEVREQVRQVVMKARFSPAMKNSKPRDTEVTLTLLVGEKLKSAVNRQEVEADIRANGASRIGLGVINGKATSLPKPEYPFAARGSRAGGPVRVEIDIDEQGNVFRALASSGHPALRDASRNAACRAKFSPTILDGRPIKVSGVLTYNFVAPRPGSLP